MSRSLPQSTLQRAHLRIIENVIGLHKIPALCHDDVVGVGGEHGVAVLQVLVQAVVLVGLRLHGAAGGGGGEEGVEPVGHVLVDLHAALVEDRGGRGRAGFGGKARLKRKLLR